jgi:hypothetical protein
MRVEAILAIIIGVILGLGVTYGIYQIRNVNAPETVTTESSPVVAQVTPTTDNSSEKILITSPEDESVLTAEQITISGSVESNQMVVMFVNERNYVTQADEIGSFAVKAALDVGSNVIRISAVSSDGTQHEKELVVIREAASSDTSTDATGSATKTSPSPTVRTTITATPRPGSTTATPRVTASPRATARPITNTPTPVQ